MNTRQYIGFQKRFGVLLRPVLFDAFYASECASPVKKIASNHGESHNSRFFEATELVKRSTDS